jgi:hypothetical protein
MPSDGKRAVDWEHIFFLAIVLTFLVWYLSDATMASPTFSNLILIAPIGAIAAVLVFYIGAIEIFGHRAAAKSVASRTGHAAAGADPSRFRTGSLGTIALLMVFFGLFVAAIPYAGFDIATFFFVIATLRLLGERSVVFMLSLALGISAAISVAALTLLTFPIPMGIARALWRAL